MLRAEPVLLPHQSPPPDWIGWRAEYDNRLGANFVRDWRPETRAAITAAFEGEFEHARGVNNLQRVALVVDPVIVDLAERFAVELMGNDDQSADARLVKDDIATARALDGQPFWLTYNCDQRGRVYPIPHLNYEREDHVRAMFRFADGLPLRPRRHKVAGNPLCELLRAQQEIIRPADQVGEGQSGHNQSHRCNPVVSSTTGATSMSPFDTLQLAGSWRARGKTPGRAL